MSQAAMDYQPSGRDPHLYPVDGQEPDSVNNQLAPMLLTPDEIKMVQRSRRPRRPRRQKDNLEYLGMMRRMLKGYCRRVVDEDPSTLAEMLTLETELKQAIDDAGHRLHYEQNYSWRDIGYEVGMTRQGAQLRWGRRYRNGEEPK